MSQVRDGSHAELVRSNQKDLTYLSQIRSSVTDIAQSILGMRRVVQWQRELTLFADVCYFGLTTCCGYQTLGEEYTDVLQVDKSGPRLVLPSGMQRVLMILLHTLSPYLLDKCLARAQLHLSQVNGPISMPEEQREKLLQLIAFARPAVEWLHRAHQVLFFLNGAFYHISKRAMDVRYIAVPRGVQVQLDALQSWGKAYRIMGYIMALQLAMNAFSWLRAMWQSHAAASRAQSSPATGPQSADLSDSTASQPSSASSNTQCTLCLSQCQHATSTLCGHIFCWACIMEACSNQPECPLCREPCLPCQLIYLRDFTAS